MSKKKFLTIALLLISAGVFARFWGAFDCDACGNTTAPRGEQTFMELNDLRGQFGSMAMRANDTIRINGGDGSSALYQLRLPFQSTPWQCVTGCGPGDEIANFIPPVGGSSGGNGGGNGGDGSGSGSGGTGGGSIPGGGGGGGGCTSTTTTCDDNGCTTTCFVH